MRDAEVNVAYRWFLGYSMSQQLPHFADVYKRQVQIRAVFGALHLRVLGVEHHHVAPGIQIALEQDVYKRQGYIRA